MRKVTCPIFLFRTHIYQNELIFPDLFSKLLHGDALKFMPPGAVCVQGALNIPELAVSHCSKLKPEACHLPVSEPIAHFASLSVVEHKPRSFEPLQVLRGVSSTHMRLLSELLHCSRRLRKQIKQFEAVGICQGACHLSEQVIESAFFAMALNARGVRFHFKHTPV
jgi:hypothetical protein